VGDDFVLTMSGVAVSEGKAVMNLVMTLQMKWNDRM
jgi:hypothetical protein